MLGSGLWFVFNTVQATASTYAQAYTASLLAGAAFTAIFLGFLHHADRWERTPANLALAAFLIGGFGATFAIAITGNAAMMSLYAKLFGQPSPRTGRPG